MAKDLKILITAKDKATRVMNRLGSTVKSITASVFSLRGAFAVLAGAAGIGLVTRSLIRTSSEFENLRIQLNALQGSAKAGGEALAWVKKFARETPLSLQDVTKSFVTMRAFGLDPMNGSMLKLVDTSSKLGGGAERLTSIVRAVGQMFTKGKIQAEEMNRQLTEVGVPAWDLLSKKMGLSVSVLQDMSAKGQLGRKEILLLIDAIGEFGKGSAIANMRTMSGIMSNFGDQVSQAKDAFASAKGGLTDFVKSGLSLLTDELERLRGTGGIKRLGEDLGTSLINALRSGIEAIIEMLNWFDLLIGSVKLAIINFLEMNKAIAKVTDSIGFTSGEVEAFQKQINALEIDAGTFFLSAEERTRSIEDIDIFFGKLEKRFEKFRSETAAREALDATGGGITDGQILGMDLRNSQLKFDQETIEFTRLGNETKAEIERAHLQQLFEMDQESANRRIELEEGTAERLRNINAQKIENSRRTNAINISGAQGLGVALAQIAGASNKKIFAINKVFAVASILIDTQAAAAKAMATILPPANFAVAAQIEADGFRRAAFAGAIGLAQGISGGGGSSGGGGGGGNVPGAAPNFQQQQNQGSTINLTINAIDSKSFLDNVDQVLEPIAEKLADHIGANGSSGQFNFVLERS